jgi:hypothetical protein
LELAFRDASDVQQIVDKACFQLDISSDHFKCFLDGRGIRQLGFKFSHHGDHGRERTAQFVRKLCQELVLRGICGNQFLTQRDIACLIFHQIKHALDSFLRPLQSKQVDVEEMRYTRLIFQRVFDQLKRRSKVKDPLNCPGRRNLYIITSDFGNVAVAGHLSEALSHPGKCIIGMQKPARNRID